jgi:bifunctional UDP-N-acetylglucosamine pyrophosphorylase/glucosamine-1-phosphate N-acetyltransferase
LRAVILAAGEGRRFFPYDLTRQKAAAPVGDTYVVRWTVDCLRRAGVAEVTVVVGHRQERVRHALRDVEGVRYAAQGERRGTAHAVLTALAGADEPADGLLVLYGDALLDEEGIAAFVAAVADKRPFAAAMLSLLDGRDPGNWLGGSFSGDRLTGVSGHNRGGSHRLCGVYALSPEALRYVEANPGVMEQVPVGGMPPMEAELAQSFQLMLDDAREVLAVEQGGLFVDLDKPWHLLEANHRFAEYLCGRIGETRLAAGARVDDGAEVSGHIVAGADAVIGRRVVVKGDLIVGAGTSITNGAMVGGNCVIGRDCRIRDYALLDGGSVLRDECIVGHGAEMGGVLLDGAYLYHYCEMSGVFGARFDAGAATVCGTLRFDDGEARHEVLGRRETPEVGANASYIGDYTRTGVNAILMPGVKVGAYSCIGPGVILYDDVPHGTLVLAQQEQSRKPWGPHRYGW